MMKNGTTISLPRFHFGNISSENYFKMKGIPPDGWLVIGWEVTASLSGRQAALCTKVAAPAAHPDHFATYA